MADNKKYYYLKLKEGFFDSDDMKLLQAMKDGYVYSDILLKLYLQSLRQEGRLMYRGIVPYTPDMIATITNHQVGTVEKAMRIFEQMGFIEILDNGAIYMSDIQNFIGQSSKEADRKRKYRGRENRIMGHLEDIPLDKCRTESGTIYGQKADKTTDKCPANLGQMSEKCPGKSEIDIIAQNSDNVKNIENTVVLGFGNESDVGTNCGQMSHPEKTLNNNIYINNHLSNKEKDKENINTFARSSGEQTFEPEADVEALILNDGSEWKPTEALFAEYVRLYPNVDVKQQFNEMRGWCLSNPAKRKTRRGITRFVNSWLSRQQDRGAKCSTPAANKFNQFQKSDYDIASIEQNFLANGGSNQG